MENVFINLGIAGVMLFLVWRKLETSDKEHSEFVKETIESLKTMVAQTTEALVNKNNSDLKMADALESLTEELRKLKEKNNG